MDNFLRIGLLIAVLGLSASTVWLGATGENKAAGITAALCFGLCIFVFLYRFKRFKGMGFEGELWEQEMEKAAELRLALKDLAERVGESVYWDLGEGSRLGASDPNKILGIIERTDKNLQAMEIEPAKIEEMKRPWHKPIMHDLAKPITDRLNELAKKKLKEIDNEISTLGYPVPEEHLKKYKDLAQKKHEFIRFGIQLHKLIWRDDYENVPNILRQTIDQADWLTDDERQVIYLDSVEEFSDIDQYALKRTVRRHEVLHL